MRRRGETVDTTDRTIVQLFERPGKVAATMHDYRSATNSIVLHNLSSYEFNISKLLRTLRHTPTRRTSYHRAVPGRERRIWRPGVPAVPRLPAPNSATTGGKDFADFVSTAGVTARRRTVRLPTCALSVQHRETVRRIGKPFANDEASVLTVRPSTPEICGPRIWLFRHRQSPEIGALHDPPHRFLRQVPLTITLVPKVVVCLRPTHALDL